MKQKIIEWLTYDAPIDLNKMLIGKPYQPEKLIAWSKVGGLVSLLIIIIFFIWLLKPLINP